MSISAPEASEEKDTLTRSEFGRGQTFASPLNKEAGRLLAAYRRQRRWSQLDLAKFLADKIGWSISPRTVKAWELGVRAVPAAALVALGGIRKPGDEAGEESSKVPPPEYAAKFLKAVWNGDLDLPRADSA